MTDTKQEPVKSLRDRVKKLEAALRKIERNAHGGYLMGGSYVNPCGCDRIAHSALEDK